MKDNNELVIRHEVAMNETDKVILWHQHGNVYQQYDDAEPIILHSFGVSLEGIMRAMVYLEGMLHMYKMLQVTGGVKGGVQSRIGVTTG